MTTTRLAIDIETEPNPDLIASIPEPEVLTGNLKDPIKIAEKQAAAKADQIAKMALDPHYGRILAVGFARRVQGNEKSCSWVQLRAGACVGQACIDAEQTLLRASWEIIGNHAGGYVTFNGSAFDIPYMVRRSMLLGVPVVKLPCGKYQTTDCKAEHLDVYNLLANADSNPLRLPRTLYYFAYSLLGRECPHDVDHAKLGELFASGPAGQQVVREICEWDAVSTLLLAELCERYYL
jgi:hypothetical protein